MSLTVISVRDIVLKSSAFAVAEKDMRITFLIGNGFDLAVGLKTSFTDFFPIYCEQESNTDIVVKFKKDIKKDIEKDSQEDSGKITWADFERKMGEHTTEYLEMDDFTSCMIDFKKSFIKHLQKEEARVNFKDESIRKDILSKFRKSLFAIPSFFPFVLNNNLQENFFSRYPLDFTFVNFNYTTIFDKCIEFLKEDEDKRIPNQNKQPGKASFSVKHIHGTMEEPILMGVDNVAQIKNETFSKSRIFQQTLIKPDINERLANGYHSQISTHIEASDVIIVFGMSMGETDASWWRKICDWLSNYHYNRRLIIFAKTSQDADSKNNSEIPFRIEDSVKNRFLGHSKLSEATIEAMHKRIHVALNKNIFDLPLAK